MDLLKIIGFGFCGVFFSTFLKSWRPELAFQIIIATSLVIVFNIISSVVGVFEYIYDISEKYGIDGKYISIVIKIIGIAYIGQFASDICSDYGHKSIAGKIELGAKFIILMYALPIADNLLNTIMTLMP